MLIITKEGVQALSERLKEGKTDQCREELEKMLEIKDALLWRAEAAQCCCCVSWELPAHLAREVQLLEGALAALEEGDTGKAAALLEDYVSDMD